jgi:hypothetical protein
MNPTPVFFIVVGVISVIVGWFVQPALNAAFVGSWVALAAVLLLAGAASIGAEVARKGRLEWRWLTSSLSGRLTAIGAVMVPLALAVWFITSAPVFHAARYAALIGDMRPVPGNAAEVALPNLSIDRAPLVTRSVAQRAAENRLGGEDPALGSVVEIGRMTRQTLNGRLVWVGPLEHRGLFAWLRNRTTPGYVVVDASNPEKVEVVRSVGDKPLQLRYLESAFLQEQLHRHAYLGGAVFEALGTTTFQLDDAGKPFAVLPLLSHAIGMSAPVVSAVLVIDVQSGVSERYTRDAAPAWIDRIEPPELVFHRLEDWGRYHSGGWFNPSQAGRLQTSTWELDLVCADDGHNYWVTGLTSVGRDTSLTGLVLVDTRTGKPRRYALSGIVEEQASAIVEQTYREKGYKASNPTPLLVEGTPAYVMSLTDDAGSTKAYGMVAVGNKEAFATAPTLEATLRMFQSRQTIGRRAGPAEEGTERQQLAGRIARIGSAVREGNSWFYFTLEEQPQQLLVATGELNEELALTKTGDTVKVEFLLVESGSAEVRSFENVTLGRKAGTRLSEHAVE